MRKLTILFFVGSILLCACAKKEEKKQVSMPPTPAELVRAEAGNVSEYISTMGTIASQNSVNIVPQVSGQIVAINFKQGQSVKKGDILAVIDKRPYQAVLMQAKGALRQAKAQLKIDELSVVRNKKLAKDGYVDKQTYDSLVAKVEVDKGIVETALANVKTAEINLDWCDIKAPVDGKVGLYNINIGNVVASGSSVITTIENVEKLFVDFIIPSQRLYDVLNFMKTNNGKMSVEVSYIEEIMSERKRKAEVSVVLNKIRYESGTAVLRGSLDNDDFMFWPNQPVNVRVDLKKIPDSVLIPDICIQLNAIGPYIYVATPVKNGVFTVRMVQIKKGQLFGENRSITGIKVGDYVVKRISQLRLQAGPFVYRTTTTGVILDENGKPLTSKEAIMKFMGDATKVADELRAEMFKKMASSNKESKQK